MLLHWRSGLALRVLFYAACAIALAVALAPVSGEAGSGADKLQHFAAFYGLALLGLIAHPRRSVFVLAIGLALFGGLIEILQGLPIVARDRDLADWVADILGVAMAVAPLSAVAWRRKFL